MPIVLTTRVGAMTPPALIGPLTISKNCLGAEGPSQQLHTAVDTEPEADPSVGSAVLGPAGSWARSATGGLSARAAAEAVRSAAASRSADASLRAVIEMALRSGAWDAASISARGPRGTMQPAASSDPWAAEAGRLQFEVGEGPCLDAVRPEPDGARPDQFVVATDLSTEHRWPRWGPAATAMDIRTVVALRLFTDHTVGSISLYSRRSQAFDLGALEDAQIVAALGSVALAQVSNERGLWRAVHSRGLIGQAQGMLMERYGLTAEAAFGVLRRYSQQHNTRLVVLAEQLATTGDLPDFVQPAPGH